MIYPKTHVHCKPGREEFRLCEGCGRILLDAEENGGDTEEGAGGGENDASGGIPAKSSNKGSPRSRKR
jgi:hypothetical protein